MGQAEPYHNGEHRQSDGGPVRDQQAPVSPASARSKWMPGNGESVDRAELIAGRCGFTPAAGEYPWRDLAMRKNQAIITVTLPSGRMVSMLEDDYLRYKQMKGKPMSEQKRQEAINIISSLLTPKKDETI